MKNNIQAKTNHNKTILSSIILLMVFLSLFLCSNFNFTMITASANNGEEIVYDTNFMYSPSHASVYGNTTLVLDTTSDSILKIVDNKIVQGESSTTSANGANYMFSLDTYLVLVNSKSHILSEMITILSAETLEHVYIAQSLETKITSYYDHISSYADSNTLYLLFYSFGLDNGVSDMMYLTISLDNQSLTISSPRILTINTNLVGNNFQSNIKSINIVKNQNDQYVSCIVHSNNDIFSFEIRESNEIANINGTNLDVSSLGVFTNMTIFSHENQSYIAFEKENNLEVYKLNQSSSDTYEIVGNKVTIDTSLSIVSSITVHNNSLLVCSISAQKVFKADISSQDEEIQLSNPSIIANPSIENVLYDTQELSLMEVTSDASISLQSTPYSTKGQVTLSPNTNIVEIGEGKINNTVNNTLEPVNGYKYYLATVNGTNYYGYLPISAVTKIELSDSTMPYAFTRKNVKMYKYPTSTEDQTNTVLMTFEDITKVELVRDISEFSYTVGENNAIRTFYEVQVNNQIGYILSTDIDSFPEIELVQTNAVVLRSTSVYKNLSDELPTWSLSNGARVRILENRFGTEKYTKISFNDDDGVTCTGYVLADNIQADSWSTLQIIGFVLVLLSIVLLVIILIIKHRINKE